MADERIEFEISKALRDIAQLITGLNSVATSAKKAGSAFDDAFSAQEAQGVADALDDLQKQYDSLKRSADTLKTSLRNATNPELIKLYAQNIAKLEGGMKRLSDVGAQAGVNLEKANKAAGTGRQVFENYFGAFTKATLIIAAVDAVIKFTKYSVGLAESLNKSRKQFEAFTGSADAADKIVQSLTATGQKFFIPTDEILKAGKSLLAFGENADALPDVLGRIADISAATGKDFQELTTIYGKARAAGVLYAEDINQLVDAGIPIIQEFSKQMGVSNDQVKKLASEGKISFEELQLALFNLTAEGGKFANQSAANADSLSGAWQRAVASVAPAIEKIGGYVSFFLKESLDGFTLVTELVKNLFSETPKGKIEVDYTGRDAYEAAKDDLYERQRLEEAAEKQRKAKAKTNAAEIAKIEKEKNALRIQAMKDGEEKEIATENLRFSELKKQLEKYHLDTSQAEEQHQQNLLKITSKYAIERFQAEQDLIELRKAQAEFDAKQAEQSIERERKLAQDRLDIRESEIDLMEQQFANIIRGMQSSGKSQEEVARQQATFDELIQAERLKNQIAFQEALLSSYGQGDEAQITQIKNTILKLKAALEGLSIKLPEVDGGDGKDGGRGLFGKLFPDLTDEGIAMLEKGVQDVASIISDLTDIQVEAAEKRIKAAQDQTEAAQAFYDEQKRLNEEGYANDLDLAERRLTAAQQQEERALAQKKKAQRQQILIESALQAANIATAASNTLKTFNGPLLPVGIALVAAMIGAFVASKAKALQATKFRKGGEGYVDGRGVIVGNSHEAGGVRFEAEGGEFYGSDGKRFGIVNKRMTAKHFDLLQAINQDNRDKMRTALESLTAPIDRERVLGAAGGSVAVVVGKDKETYRLLKSWKQESVKKKSTTFVNGYRIEQEGNTTRKIKIK